MARILVALDETDASGRVAQFVNDFFGGKADVEILAISVARGPATWIPPAAGYGWVYGWGWPAALSPQEIEAARDEVVERAEQTLERQGIADDEAIVEVGDPTVVILQAARDRGVDLVVVGTNHKNLLERLFSRSVSHEVLRESDRPVLLVP